MDLDGTTPPENERGRGMIEPTVVEEHPCDPCQHSARCAAGLACAALQLFINTGRVSAVAPRQPSAAIYARIYGKSEPAPAKRSSTMLAISLLRANPCRMR